MANVRKNTPKPIYTSKLFWLNLAGAGAIVLRCIAEQRVPDQDEMMTLLVLAGNVGLRFKTDRPVTVR